MLFTRQSTYEIIKKQQDLNIGFKTENLNMPALFYADDGLTLARTKHETNKTTDIIANLEKEFGLEINKAKAAL